MGRFHLSTQLFSIGVCVNSMLVDNLFHSYKFEASHIIVLLASHCKSGGNAFSTLTYFLIF